MHILTLPIQNVNIFEYDASTIPTPFPQIPSETCRLIIKSFHVPRVDPTTTNSSRVFVSLRLFTNNLEPCNELGGFIYSIEEVRKWVMMHIIQSKSNKKFSVHLDTESGQATTSNINQTPQMINRSILDKKPPAIQYNMLDNVVNPFDQEGDV